MQLLLEHLNFLAELGSISFFWWRAQGNFLVQVRLLIRMVRMRSAACIGLCLARGDLVNLWSLLLQILLGSALM